MSLDAMINYWHSNLNTLPEYSGSMNDPMPLVFSEINFISTPSWPQDYPPNPLNPADDGLTLANNETVDYDSERDGAYMADLISWLYDQYSSGSDPSTVHNFPVRVFWYAVGDERESLNPQKQIYGPDPSVPEMIWRPYVGIYQNAPKGGTSDPRKNIKLKFCIRKWPGGGGSTSLDDLYHFLTTSPCF